MPSQAYDPELQVDWVVPHPHNPNMGDEDALEESIDEVGFVGAILVRQIGEWQYELIAGEHRWKNRKKNKIETIPAIIAHDMSDEAALKLLLSDNEVTRRGRYDNEKLTKALRSLPNTRGTGFPLDALAKHEARRQRQEIIANPPEQFVREYGVVVTCKTEVEQEELYNRLVGIGVDPEQMRVVSI